MPPLESNHLAHTKDLIKSNFLADSRSWVIAFSGGKDSTLVLQLVYEMLATLPRAQHKPIYIISSDTGVEPPPISRYLQNTLSTLAAYNQANALNIKVHLVKPPVEHSFWVNLIGKGYPPPTRWFRWCTSKMKIKPSRQVIEQITQRTGSVILLLGSRLQESQNRARAMSSRKSNNRGLNPHHEIPNTLVMAPIASWSTDQVWEYLFENNPPPWGTTHDTMLQLYKQANSGECPVIMDSETPSCGGSRFGCWTCTVVKTDKSMESFITHGEAWMQPLNDFRNWLKEIREDKNRRSRYKRNGQLGIGPFDSNSRQEILEKLLAIEQQVGHPLISNEEIRNIQETWRHEFDVMNSALRIAGRYQRFPMQQTQHHTPEKTIQNGY